MSVTPATRPGLAPIAEHRRLVAVAIVVAVITSVIGLWSVRPLPIRYAPPMPLNPDSAKTLAEADRATGGGRTGSGRSEMGFTFPDGTWIHLESFYTDDEPPTLVRPPSSAVVTGETVELDVDASRDTFTLAHPPPVVADETIGCVRFVLYSDGVQPTPQALGRFLHQVRQQTEQWYAQLPQDPCLHRTANLGG